MSCPRTQHNVPGCFEPGLLDPEMSILTVTRREPLLDYSFQTGNFNMLTLRIVVTLLTLLLMYSILWIISGIFSQDVFFFSVPEHHCMR